MFQTIDYFKNEFLFLSPARIDPLKNVQVKQS